MKIPKEVKIGAHKIKVEFKELPDGLDGESSTERNSITIDKALPKSQREVTLIHEALHLMNATWGESREGHTLLESISQQMYQFLSDNKFLK